MEVLIKLELPPDLQQFKLPPGVNERLQYLLDRQDRGETLTTSEHQEAEGLVDISEMLSLLSLRVEIASRDKHRVSPRNPIEEKKSHRRRETDDSEGYWLIDETYCG